MKHVAALAWRVTARRCRSICHQTKDRCRCSGKVKLSVIIFIPSGCRYWYTMWDLTAVSLHTVHLVTRLGVVYKHLIIWTLSFTDSPQSHKHRSFARHFLSLFENDKGRLVIELFCLIYFRKLRLKREKYRSSFFIRFESVVISHFTHIAYLTRPW